MSYQINCRLHCSYTLLPDKQLEKAVYCMIQNQMCCFSDDMEKNITRFMRQQNSPAKKAVCIIILTSAEL